MTPGLGYTPNYLTVENQASLVEIMNTSPWQEELTRRVQHYGYKYDYKARKIDHSMRLGPLPAWAQEQANLLYQKGFFAEVPDQVIVNEYEPGQGISRHTDCIPCFSETIASISLGSSCLMDFTNTSSLETFSLFLQAGSLLVLQREARYDWQHEIKARKTDKVDGVIYPRSKRISITFRKVIL